jgi:hypothetical protein
MVKIAVAVALVAAGARAEQAPLKSVVYSDQGLAVPGAAPSEHHFGLVGAVDGATQVFHGDLLFRPAPWVTLGLGGGGIPVGLGTSMLGFAGVNGGQLSSWSAEAKLMLHPFQGSFFLGASVGHMELSAAARTSAGPVDVNVATEYVAPRLGWLATWDSGFTLGFDVGAQIPLGPEVTATAPSKSQTTVESLSRSLAALPLPTLGFRLGWML